MGKLYTFPNDPNCAKPDLFLDLTTELKTLDPKVHKKNVGPGRRTRSSERSECKMVAQTTLRLLEFELDADHGQGTWWSPPEWNRRKKHPSILDLRRLLWRHRQDFSQFLVELEELPKVDEAAPPMAMAS